MAEVLTQFGPWSRVGHRPRERYGNGRSEGQGGRGKKPKIDTRPTEAGTPAPYPQTERGEGENPMVDASLIFTKPIVNGSGAKDGQNCSVELLGLAIYGDYRHGFQLPCLDLVAQNAVVSVNDHLSVEAKQTRRWRLLVARLALCHKHDNDRLRRRMALWAARSVEHLATDPRVKACNDVLERWIDGEATDEELAEAREGAWAARTAATTTVATAATAATTVAATAATTTATAATTTATAATTAATYATELCSTREEALMDWLDRYLTAWHKTAVDEGEAIPEVQEDEYVRFCEQLDELTRGETEIVDA